MNLSDSPNATGAPHAQEAANVSVDRFAQRRTRIAEYAEQAVRESDPHDAVIDSTEADMMLVQSFVSEAVQGEMQSTVPTMEALERLLPAIAMQSQLTKLGVSLAKLKEKRLDRQAQLRAIDAPPTSTPAISDQRHCAPAVAHESETDATMNVHQGNHHEPLQQE
jgi:hypothetical protein